MNLSKIDENAARRMVYTLMAEDMPGCLYPQAWHKRMIVNHIDNREATNYHKLLTFLAKDCGFHYYKIINRVAKAEVL
jgi:hypothetical protein